VLEIRSYLSHGHGWRFFVAIAIVWLVIAIGAWCSVQVSRGGLIWLEWTPETQPALGAENDNISRALRSGRGFADPFGTPTGPTAWMPPAFPVFLALLYTISNDDREVVTDRFFVFQWSSFGLLGSVLVIYANVSTGRPITMALIYAFGIWGFHFPVFLFSHGQAIEAWAVMLVLLALSIQRSATLRNSYYGGLIAGFAALAYPAASVGWCIMTAWQWRQNRLYLVNSILMALLVVAPWIGRNLSKFNTVYPIKSNAGYELWQSLALTENGTIDADVLKDHPYFSHTKEHQSYTSHGEQAYLNGKNLEAFRILREEPLRFIQHILNRFFAAFVWHQTWFEGQSTSLWTLAISRVWKLIVFGSLIAVYRQRKTIGDVAVLAAGLMVCILMPYVLVSYYDRYSWPLIPLQAFVLFSVFVSAQRMPLLNLE